MRKLIFIFLLFFSFSAQSQTKISSKDLFVNDPHGEIKYLRDKVSYQEAHISNLEYDLSQKPKVITKIVPSINSESLESLKKDEKFIDELPKEYKELSREDLLEVLKKIESKIEHLLIQRDSILKSNQGNPELATAKNKVIKSLEKERSVITLTQQNLNLSDENIELANKQEQLRKYLYIALSIILVSILAIVVIIQRKKISVQDTEIDRQLSDINKKNNYLEHAARIIRHDMHSGINTYMPRGLSSLEKRIDEAKAKELRIDGSIKLIKEGLAHTQKVYKSVYEFTNLVKQNVVLDKKTSDLKELLEEYIKSTAYTKQVEIDSLITKEVNPSLFCTAVDNLIRNGLSFNDSDDKKVKIYMEGSNLTIQDNGRGLQNEKFEKIKKNKETGGLGLNIALAIIEEHGFILECEEVQNGTKMKIKL